MWSKSYTWADIDGGVLKPGQLHLGINQIITSAQVTHINGVDDTFEIFFDQEPSANAKIVVDDMVKNHVPVEE